MPTFFSIKQILILTLLGLLVHGWSPEAEKDRVQELAGYMNFTGKF